MKKTVNVLADLWEWLMNTLSTTHARMPVWKLQTHGEVDIEMFAKGRSLQSAHKNILRAPRYCVGGCPQSSVEPLGQRLDRAIKKRTPPESSCTLCCVFLSGTKSNNFRWLSTVNEMKRFLMLQAGWHHFFSSVTAEILGRENISCTINFRTAKIMSKSKV